MSTFVGVGFSDTPNSLEAAQNAASQILTQIPQEAPIHLCLVFVTNEYATQNHLDVIHNILEPERLIGASTAGIITSQNTQLRGIGIMAISSDEMVFGVGKINNLEQQVLHDAGIELARRAAKDYAQTKRNAFLMLADGFFHNNSLLLKGVQEVLGNGFPTVGALSSDYFEFRHTHQFFNKETTTNGAVGLILGGDANFFLGNAHGWHPLGKPHFITEADGHIIRSINGEPAINIYNHYFDDEAASMKKTTLSQIAMLYPLGFFVEEENAYMLRNVIDTLDDGSLILQGDVPHNAEVHLMMSNKESCIEAAAKAANEVKVNLRGKQAKCIIVLESIFRHKILGRNAFQEIKAIKEVLGYTTPLLGMYSYGEISPFESLKINKKTYIHNENIILLAIG